MLLAVMQSFDRVDLLSRALPSLHAALSRSRLRSEIIVFDAGSTDGSIDWLHEFRVRAGGNPAIHLIASPVANRILSFSEGTNHAVTLGLRIFSEAKFVLLFESDNQLGNAAPIERATDVLDQHRDFGALGFTVRIADGRRAGCAERFPTVVDFVCGLRIANTLQRVRRERTYRAVVGEPDVLEVDVAYTSPMLIGRSTWEKMQGLDAAAFPYSDSDIDFCWRCRRQGIRVGSIRTEAVVHDNLGQPSPWSARRVALWHQGRFRLLQRHRGKVVRLALPLLVARHACEAAVLAWLVLLSRRPVAQVRGRLKLLCAAITGYKVVS
jgi:GT2 family glycosyltransferase